MKFHYFKCFILFAFLFSACEDDSMDERDLQNNDSAQDTTLAEVEIELLDSWSIKDDSTKNILFASSNPDEAKGEFTANLTISKVSYPDSSLTAYQNYIINQYRDFDGYSIIRLKNVTISNYDAINAVFETNRGGNKIVHYTYFLYVSETGYSIHFICRNEDLEDYEPEFQEMARSVKIND